MALAKTIQSELLAITAVAANVQQLSSVLDISAKYQATVFIDHAKDPTDVAAMVGNGTEYRVQVSQKASGNDTWVDLPGGTVESAITASPSIVMDAEETAGAIQIETGATLAVKGDWVFFKNATIANSEWGKVVSVVATGGSESFTLQDGLTNTQAAITVTNQAARWSLTFDVMSYTRTRVVVNNNKGTTNRAIVCRIAMITTDTI